MPHKPVTLTIRFTSEEALRDWFEEARDLSFIEERAGVRPKDALDPGHRAGPQDFIVAAGDYTPSRWLVEPIRESLDGGEAPEVSSGVQAGDPIQGRIGEPVPAGCMIP